ncbi:MAG: LptF/LptG family permease [Flavobacteriales bacterium]|nr:LptF/LptG family permease [Flavobacteriales bacterium]
MLKTLDRYIIRQFLGTFFFILVLIMAIAVVFDISEKTEDFTESTATFKEIALDYYLNFVLYYSNFFSGLLIFLAVLLFTSRMASRSEVIAALSSGVSFPRFLRPYFIAATILASISLYVNVYLLPAANRTRLEFEKTHIWNAYRLEDHNILREVAPGTIVYMESIDMRSRSASRFAIQQWENGSMRSRVAADRAVYDSASGVWQLFDYTVRLIPAENIAERTEEEGVKPLDPLNATATREIIRRGERLDTVIPLKPSDLGQRLAIAAALDRVEIEEFIKAEKARGGNTVAFYEVEKHQRTAYPFATYVFTLIGVGIASSKVRGGTGVHLVLGVMLILVFIFMGKITTVAATNSGLDPMLAVWLPNIVFAFIGAWIYWKAPK